MSQFNAPIRRSGGGPDVFTGLLCVAFLVLAAGIFLMVRKNSEHSAFMDDRDITHEGGAVIIWSDITELRKREERLRIAKEEAESANESKTVFLMNMSHELRTPLNAVIGFADIIAQELFGEVGQAQYKAYASDILRSGHHLLDIINDILDYAKSERGKLQLHLDEVEPSAIAETR